MLTHKLTIPATLGIVFMETDIAHVRVMETGLGQSQVALMKVSSTCFAFLIVLQSTCKVYQVYRLCVGAEWSGEHSKHNQMYTVITEKYVHSHGQ